MATAERFEKSVERVVTETVIEHQPMVRLELTIEETMVLKAALFEVRGCKERTYAKQINNVYSAIEKIGIMFGDGRTLYFKGGIDAQPLPKP